MRRPAAIALAAAAFAVGGCGDHEDPVVVRVGIESATGAAETATGFVVGRGRIVTVAHVLEPERRLLVRMPGGRPRRGRILRVDRRNDLALIAVPALPGSGSSLTLRPGSEGGTRVRILGRHGSITADVMRPIRATIHGPDWGPYRRRALELRARVAPGDSGAPVVDDSGRVTAVLFARASNGAATAYAVDAAAVRTLISR